MHANNLLPDSDEADDYFDRRFQHRQYSYTADGREAISIALQYFDLHPDDVVTILTSSANFYISSCVTKTIEKFCQWSRHIKHNTKILFVNHEFGYPYPGMETLRKYNLPIIEDCAHSFFSADEDHSIGNTGDFVIYSFPKMFPIQVGGLLTAKKELPQPGSTLGATTKRYIKNVLSHYITQKDMIISRRMKNYHYLVSKLDKDHFEERFEWTRATVPGVFMFKVKNEWIDLPGLKLYLNAHGIQCSIFYGERTFFIPVHQNLEKTDLDYFVEVIHSFTANVI